MMRLMRVTKRGPNVQLGDHIYQLSSARGVSTNDVTVAILRLADAYSSAGWPIDLVVDETGGTEIIKALAVQLMSSFELDTPERRRQQQHKAAAFLRRIAERLDAAS